MDPTVSQITMQLLEEATSVTLPIEDTIYKVHSLHTMDFHNSFEEQKLDFG